jgi:type I restriction enzyme S subunit
MGAAFKLPPLAEQHQIVAEVERRLSIVAGAEAQVEANLRRADRLRQSILKQVFSGQLVPQDPNDEPVSVLLERIRNGVGAIHESPSRARHKQNRAIHESPLPKSRQSVEPKPAALDFPSLDAVLAAILGHMQPGHEYSRAELNEALGLSTGRWNAAIQELKRREKVRQVGEKRGARYSLA